MVYGIYIPYIIYVYGIYVYIVRYIPVQTSITFYFLKYMVLKQLMQYLRG